MSQAQGQALDVSESNTGGNNSDDIVTMCIDTSQARVKPVSTVSLVP